MKVTRGVILTVEIESETLMPEREIERCALSLCNGGGAHKDYGWFRYNIVKKELQNMPKENK